MHVFNDRIVANQIQVLLEYSSSYALYSEVKSSGVLRRKGSEFWVHLNDLSVNDQFIKWSKVFGTDDNELHWKKSSASAGYLDEVRDRIVRVFQGQVDDWREYQKSVVDFRNTYSAHRNIDSYRAVPYVDPGYKVAECFFDFLVDAYSPWAGHQPYLAEYVANYRKLVAQQTKI